jgi:hypothetical protein
MKKISLLNLTADNIIQKQITLAILMKKQNPMMTLKIIIAIPKVLS